MDDRKKTKEQLIQELDGLRRRIAALENGNASGENGSVSREEVLSIEAISDNLLPGMIYQVVRKPDGSRVFTYLSETVRRFYGITPQQGLADAGLIYGRICEADRRRVFREEEEANRTLTPFRSEVRMMAPEGTIRWSMFVSNPRRLADGSTCWDGIEFDITDQKRTEDALRESKEKFAKIFRTSPDAVTISRSSDGAFLDVNDGFSMVSGYPREELIGRSPLPGGLNLWLSLEDRERFVKILRESGEVLGLEMQFRRKDGAIRDGLMSARVLDIEGEPSHITIVTDITERKQVEEALRQTQKRLKIILDTVPALIWQKDLHEHYVAVNKAYLDTFLISEEEVIGKTDHDLFPRELADGFVKDDRKVLASGKPKFNIEEHFQVGSGEYRWLLTNKMVYKDGDGNAAGTIGFALDITDRKQAENALSKSEEQLRALSSRLQSVREKERASMAREIHDNLGQLLTSLKMDLSWILRHPNAKPVELKEKARGMGQLIDHTVQTVRHISTELRPRILDDFGLIAALGWQAEEFAKRTGIPCVFRSGVRQLNLKPDRSIAVFRIFQEALTNITRHSEATHVEALLKKSVNGLVLTVRDNGRGITEEDVANQQSLGLMGMRERALVLGGTVEIKGKKGKGTKVVLSLPVNN